MLTTFQTLTLLAHLVHAQSTLTPPPGSTSVSQISVTTATPSPTAPLASLVPSQDPLPPSQPWCPSEIFCAGALLQTVNVANLYSDQKTFVDKPTTNSSANVLANFQQLPSSSSLTEGDIVQFVDTNFKGEGLELEALVLSNFPENPSFLGNVTEPLVKAFAKTVHGYWSQLIRASNESALCPTGSSASCESTLIALNHTFVIPGGRFREQYYWDSFWIVEGLLLSELYDIVNSTLQNFMDELELFGFIPNGGRIYYLNRSQPPLFIQMLSRYVTVTNDQSILERALPLAEAELQWWKNNRTINVTSPFTNHTYAMARYAANNTAPRPESYLTDYLTAHGSGLDLSDSQLADLYAELASGAETGWDYSSRWLESPAAGNSDLTTLSVRETIPVDLNSILYRNHLLLADLYGSSNSTAANSHRSEAESIREGILDLFWNPTKMAFYDFSLRNNTRNDVFSVATFYPLWNGIIPDEILTSQTNAFKFFSSVNMVLNRYNGSFPVTFLETSLQWDAPDSWPNLQYIVLQALRALPSNLTSATLSSLSANQSSFDLIPSGQIGIPESQLFGQPVRPGVNASQTGSSADINARNGTVANGGNSTEGEGWSSALQRMLSNRVIAGALCSWHATGGSIPDILPRLSDAELNVTSSVNNTGNMFEKFSAIDIDSAGSGGEYTVQAGFGWTNGVVLWVASNYGSVLNPPDCPDVISSAEIITGSSGSANKSSSGSLRPVVKNTMWYLWLMVVAGLVA
ncbi:glycoside hydrolase family 37 protein [Collybiopsis luxurians FD-317 M1]|nr:glycoside hydrolase family 37 protein [Collybiopsis luxurians FD-317 M1]